MPDHAQLRQHERYEYIDTVKTQNDTVNDTVLYLIKQNNKITATEISERLSISLSTVKRKIKEINYKK